MIAPAALDGVRVLDLTRYLAGPYCTMLLADMGADVVKLEPPQGGREFAEHGEAARYFFLSVNRNKRSATLDLHHAAGRAAFLRLAERADVVVENFRPSVMPALGLGAAALCRHNPRLIYCGISGFGADGPEAERPGFDQIAQGRSGLMSITGTHEPTRVGIAIADILAGLFAAQGIATALYHRERTGAGQVVNTSLLEAAVGVLSWSAGIYFATGRPPDVAGNHHPLTAPYGAHRARDRAFNIACANARQWQALCDAIGAPQLVEDARFATPDARIVHRADLTAALEAYLVTRDAAAWVDALNDAGVPSGLIQNVAEVFRDPQVLARDMYVELPHPSLGVFKTTGAPVKLSASPAAIARVPPAKGADTEAVYAEYGFDAADLAQLRAVGAI
ncbi:MAG: CaiB/BaiF CoA transferase family protein [Candidatus Binatia bacterium]